MGVLCNATVTAVSRRSIQCVLTNRLTPLTRMNRPAVGRTSCLSVCMSISSYASDALLLAADESKKLPTTTTSKSNQACSTSSTPARTVRYFIGRVILTMTADLARPATTNHDSTPYYISSSTSSSSQHRRWACTAAATWPGRAPRHVAQH